MPLGFSIGLGGALTAASPSSSAEAMQSALGIASEDDDGNSAVKSAPVKVVEKPKGIELDNTVAQMASAVSYESLKDIFRAAWTVCLKEQQIPLKAAYDTFKANWEQV